MIRCHPCPKWRGTPACRAGSRPGFSSASFSVLHNHLRIRHRRISKSIAYLLATRGWRRIESNPPEQRKSSRDHTAANVKTMCAYRSARANGAVPTARTRGRDVPRFSSGLAVVPASPLFKRSCSQWPAQRQHQCAQVSHLLLPTTAPPIPPPRPPPRRKPPDWRATVS